MPTALRSLYFTISASYMPSGVAFGAFTVALGIPSVYAVMLSLLVFSGAVQSAFLGFWATGLDPFSMVLTAFLLNLRHTFYGPHLSSSGFNASSSDIMLIGPFLTDEVYALSISAPGMGTRNLLKLSVYGYINWFIATVIGVTLAALAPIRIIEILLIALPALFIGLLMPRIRNGPTIITAASAICIAITGRILDLPSYFIIVPILAGVLLGYYYSKARGVA